MLLTYVYQLCIKITDKITADVRGTMYTLAVERGS